MILYNNLFQKSVELESPGSFVTELRNAYLNVNNC